MPQVRQNSITRSEALLLLRSELSRLTDDDTSICKAAAERGIFCNGFKRYGDGELRRRYDWLARHNPAMTRPELEEMANKWQLARQEIEEMPLACDVQQKVHDTCNGWDDFSNEELSHFYSELTGRPVSVV